MVYKSLNLKDLKMSLERVLSVNLLTDEMQAEVYKKVQNLKYYGDQLSKSQSQADAIAYQKAVMQAYEPSVKIYEWLLKRGVSELNAIVLLASFYLINLSDVTFKEPTSFTDKEMKNMVDSFLWAMGAQGLVNISSYTQLIRIGVNWLLNHPRE